MGEEGVNKPGKNGDVVYGRPTSGMYVSLEILITGFASKISSNIYLVYYLHKYLTT